MHRERSATRIGALVVASLPLAVYILTLQNGLTPAELQGGDPITHQYAQATLRFANAPGYPLFTVLGWLWFQLSAWPAFIFNPIERLAFYSALYAVPSLVLLYFISLKLQASISNLHYPISMIIAALATLFFAFTYFFWYYAISSENYSSGVLNSLLIIALALRWQERRDERTLLWLSFVCGLSLAHLLTVALAVPAVVLFVLGQQPDLLRRPRLLLKIVGVTLLPLLSYLYILWRGAEHPEWRGQGAWPNAWSWFLDFLMTRQGQAELTWSWDGIPSQMISIISAELTGLVLIGGLLGLCLLPRWRALLLLGIIALYAPIMYIDRYGNWFQAIIPLYPVFVVGFALLAHRTYVLCAKRFAWPLATSALLVLMLALVLNRLLINFPKANLRDRPEATGLLPGWQLLKDEPARGARIVGVYQEDLALDYLTQVWGARPDVRPLQPSLISRTDAPVYVSRAAMPLAQKSLPPHISLASAGPSLIALRQQPAQALPSSARPYPLTLAHGLELAGYEWRPRDDLLDLALYWREADTRIDVDMAISLRPMQGAAPLTFEGQPVQVDSAHPVFGFYPMTRWAAGEIVRDDYALPLSAATADHVRVILYRTRGGGFENLAAFDLPLPP